MAIVLKRYNQEFTSVSSVLVTHNLGRVPEHIIIFDLNAQHIESPTLVSIVNDSLNVSTVTFSSPQSGSVQIAAEADEVWLANNLTYEVGQANLLNVHLIEVRNETGVTISANKSVYQSGYNTTYNLPLVDLADNTNSAKMPAIGLVLADIGNGLSGYVCVSGVFPNVVNTSSYAIRDVLYVGTSGNLTNINPGGVSSQDIATVFNSAVSGKIYINDVFKLGYASVAAATPKSYIVTSQTTATTTSLTDVFLTSMSITPNSGTYMIHFNGLFSVNTANKTLYIEIYVGGVIQPSMARRTDVSSANTVFGMTTLGGAVVNGSQSIEIYWRVSGGTGSSHERSMAIFSVQA